MRSSLRGGRWGDVAPDRRRRAGRRSPLLVESLESRRLLAAGGFGINVAIDPYASLVNFLQLPGRYYDYDTEGNAPALNASGDPASDASLVFDYRVNEPWNGPDPNAVPPDLSGTYHLSFNGQATISTAFPEKDAPFTVQNQAYDASTNTTTADLVIPAGNAQDLFVVSFSGTRATATSPVDTGFSNARLIRPGYAADSTQLYTDEFLAALGPYGTLRYLEPDNANGQPFYHDNTLVTVGASQVDQTGVPWEYLIALANQTQTDMWINIPQGATDDYVAALAGIFKGGGTVGGVAYPGLDPNLKIYLEYSNEVWGGVAFNEYYQVAAVQNTADDQPLSTFSGNQDLYNNVDGSTSTDVYTAVGRRDVEETADIGRIFQSVLGADPTHRRIRPVLGWQEDQTAFYPAALGWYEHFFGPAGAAFYGIGDANYFSPTDDSTVGSVLSTLQAQETSYSVPDTARYTALATYYGLANVSYEGGPSIAGDGTTAGDLNALAASRDPGMETIVLQHYLDFYAAGGTLAMYFDGPFDTWSPSNEWSAAELAQYGDPMAAAKYRGTADVAASAPVAVTAGAAVSSTGPTSFDASTDSLGAGFSSPTAGQQGYWLLNVARGGTYDLTLSTATRGGATPGRVEVLLDDRQVGGIIGVPASSSIDLGNLPLSAGLDTISILVVSNSGGAFAPARFTLTPPPAPALPAVGDYGFESVPVGAGGFAYGPAGSAWAFAGTAGVSGVNSGFSAGNGPPPQGAQVAFLQQLGTITQSVPSWAAGSYAISFDAAQRGDQANSAEDFAVLVDGNVVGRFKPAGASYQAYTTGSFTVSAGAHTIEFLGLDGVGGDNTAMLDAVTVASAAPPPPSGPAVGDSGFEAVPVGAGNFAYDPSGSPWAFAGGSGVSGNNSGFTSGNGPAPQGTQVAFLQERGTIGQSVGGWADGSYTISFDAAQRGNFGTSAEDFEVLVDGVVVGKFKPSGSAYQSYATATFTVSAGSHTIVFQGLDTVGGDNTAMLDDVSIGS